MIRPNEEPLSIEGVLQFADGQYYPEALSFGGGVIFLGSSEPSAPIPDRVKYVTGFLLQEGAANVVGAGVHFHKEFSVRLGQGRDGGAQQCGAKVLKLSDRGVGMCR